MDLTKHNVHESLGNCMYAYNDDDIAGFEVTGVFSTILISPERLDHEEENILSYLNQLPESFRGVNGDDFYKMDTTKAGVKWSDFPEMTDELVILGLAINKLELIDVPAAEIPYIKIK